MSYRLVGTLRAELAVAPSPTLELILELLGEGYTLAEIDVIADISISAVSKWTHSDEAKRTRPSRRTDAQATRLLATLREHFSIRSDRFPLPPETLRQLLLL